jgi:hypothetical protein
VHRVPPAAAAAADGVAIVAFATLGLLTHEGELTGAGYARTALPFLAGWFVVAALAGLYRRPSLLRFAAVWSGGVAAGLLTRALLLDDPPAPAFVVVSFAVVLALTGLWRLTILAAVRLDR